MYRPDLQSLLSQKTYSSSAKIYFTPISKQQIREIPLRYLNDSVPSTSREQKITDHQDRFNNLFFTLQEENVELKNYLQKLEKQITQAKSILEQLKK